MSPDQHRHVEIERAQPVDVLRFVDEADARVVTLTDSEVAQIDGRIEKLPAGGILEAAIAVLIIVLLVIVILKVAGKIK